MSVSAVFLAIAVAAILVAVYTALGGPALWRRTERTERVIGSTISFSRVEGIDGHTTLPPGVVVSYDAGRYLVNLETPVPSSGGDARALKVSARHVGFPISASRSWRAVAANVELATGQQFIAFASVSPPSNRWGV